MDALTQLKNTVDAVVKTNGKQGITGANLQESLNTMIDTLGNGVTETTYAALVTLRDAGELTPGMWYRITDYACTTTQTGTRSAGNQYDILVLATAAGTLSENALAAHHSGDTYFADSKLEAWRLKYCLDNDTARFLWADEENGTGVVWWMRDEWENECFYDFKNIRFERRLVTKSGSAFNDTDFYFGVGYGDGKALPRGVYRSQLGVERWCYTFSLLIDGETAYRDASLKTWLDEATIDSLYNVNGLNAQCVAVGNHIGECRYVYNSDMGEHLNVPFLTLGNNVFYSYLLVDEDTGNYTMDFAMWNKLGRNSDLNTFGKGCINNTVGDNACGNTFAAGCENSTFGNGWRYSNLEGFARFCSFGGDDKNNKIKSDVENVTFGDSVHNVTLQNSGLATIYRVTVKGGVSDQTLIYDKAQGYTTIGWTWGINSKEELVLYCEAD